MDADNKWKCTGNKPSLSIVFWVGFIGTLLAFYSIGINLFTALTLILKKHVRNSFNLYFGLISLADFILAVVFLLMYSTFTLAEHFEIVILANIHYASVILVFYISTVSICFQSIHTLMAGLEKFATICKPNCNFSSCARIFLCVIAVVFALFINRNNLFFITVVHNENCYGVHSHHLQPSKFLEDRTIFYIIFEYFELLLEYTRPLLTFVVLIMLIIAISTCKRQNEEHRGSKRSDLMEVFTLIATLITFLIAQTSLVVGAAIIILSDSEFPRENFNLIDYVPLLELFISCIRILIYLGISPSLRSELLNPCRKQYPADECNDGANIPLQNN